MSTSAQDVFLRRTQIIFIATIMVSCMAHAMDVSAHSTAFAGWRASAPSAVIPVAVFGEDDRQELPPELHQLKKSIGLVYSNSARSVCTGFCVAPNVVATASHCLFRTEGEQRPLLRRFRFALRAASPRRESPIEGYRTNNPGQFVLAGSRKLRVVPPIDATKDWALMRLQKPICQNAALPLADIIRENLGVAHNTRTLEQISFHNDISNWRLSYSGQCQTIKPGKQVSKEKIARDFKGAEGLVLHGCDTGGASSGSPVFQRGADNKLRVVAINVGTYIQTKVVTRGGRIVRRYQADAIANTAVTTQKIRVFLSYFSQADIIESPRTLRLLQAELKSRGFYNYPIDGSFGPATRRAIQAYSGTPELELAGLPTGKLLKRLLPKNKNINTHRVLQAPKPARPRPSPKPAKGDWRRSFVNPG